MGMENLTRTVLQTNRTERSRRWSGRERGGGAEKRETSGERSGHSSSGTEKADERQHQEGDEYAYVHVLECQNNQTPSKPSRGTYLPRKQELQLRTTCSLRELW